MDEPAYNFGDLDSEQVMNHTFVLRNIGDTRLEIVSATPACGCTVANISDKKIDPGSEATVTVRLTLKTFRGKIFKTVAVKSNDPVNSSYTLTLEGNATTAYDIVPDRVLFGKFISDDPGSKTVNISTGTAASLKITGYDSPSKNLTAQIKAVENSKSYRVTISLTPGSGLPNGRFDSVVHLHTDNADHPLIDIPVSAVIVGELAVAPAEVLLGEQPGQPVTRYIMITPGKTKLFEIKSVEAPGNMSGSPTETHIIPLGEDGYRIQLKNLVPTKDLNGKSVKIVTNVEKMKEITIPIRVLPAEKTSATQPAAAPSKKP